MLSLGNVSYNRVINNLCTQLDYDAMGADVLQGLSAT